LPSSISLHIAFVTIGPSCVCLFVSLLWQISGFPTAFTPDASVATALKINSDVGDASNLVLPETKGVWRMAFVKVFFCVCVLSPWAHTTICEGPDLLALTCSSHRSLGVHIASIEAFVHVLIVQADQHHCDLLHSQL
jgi:hypothetical protein